MKRQVRFTCVFLVLACVGSLSAIAASQFVNGDYDDFVLRPDVEGNHVGAHHGGILFVDGKYWWYGQSFRDKSARDGGDLTTDGVVMYSSTDLVNWKNEGVILACTPQGDLKGPMRFERAKIIYNDQTKKFVMWFHYVNAPGKHGFNIGEGDAGVATCDTINGTYEFHGYHRPLGSDMRVTDCTLFKDDDGKAYFIFDSGSPKKRGDRYQYIASLSDDYLKTTKVSKIPNSKRREAPAMIKKNGYYFLITSGLTSWNPNPTKVHRATNIWGPYEDLGNFCVGEKREITFNAQSTYILELQDKPGSYVFMGDRWNRENMKRSAHIWLPLEFPTQDTVSMRYHKEWDTSIFDVGDTLK